VTKWLYASEPDAFRAEAAFGRRTGLHSSYEHEKLERMTDAEIQAMIEKENPKLYLRGFEELRAVVPWLVPATLLVRTGGLSRIPSLALEQKLGAISRVLWLGTTLGELITGTRPALAIVVANASYASAGLLVNDISDGFVYPLLFRAGPPGWIAAGLYTIAKGVAAYYLGDAIERWYASLFQGDPMRSHPGATPRSAGLIRTINRIGP
jgi:hypothetical protein